MKTRNLNYEKVLNLITLKLNMYINEYGIESIVCGISGGLDSGINMAILAPICRCNGVELIGRYISIESNSKEEEERADLIGKLYCENYKKVDLTELYKSSVPVIDDCEEGIIGESSMAKKIRLGNIKARLRMFYLYNLASKNKGLVLDNDNLTERELGFWTLNGDVGDLTPLSSLFKTEVFSLAKYMKDITDNENEKYALELLINAVPTDGLGITSSDVEQFGVSSYNEVDDILMTLMPYEHYEDIKDKSKRDFERGMFRKLYDELSERYGKIPFTKVWNRHINSSFKRKWPHRLLFNVDNESIDDEIKKEEEKWDNYMKMVLNK